MKTAKYVGSVKIGSREAGIYEVNPPVQYTGMGGNKFESKYIVVSVLQESWVAETCAYACNSRGRLLDVDRDEVWVADGVVGELEALELKGYKING